jgi:hypothetical protein
MLNFLDSFSKSPPRAQKCALYLQANLSGYHLSLNAHVPGRKFAPDGSSDDSEELCRTKMNMKSHKIYTMKSTYQSNQEAPYITLH